MQWSGVCFHGKEQTHLEDKATSVSINPKFSLIAVGTRSGIVYVYSAQSHTTPPVLSHKLQLTAWKKSVGSVSSLCWTSDGHAISVGYKEQGLSIWSVYGSMLFASNELDEASEEENLKDTYMKGVRSLFWGPGNHQLFVLSTDEANTSNFRDYQENSTAIDPAAVAWTHIQYPALYITDNWPIRYSSISSDGNYIAVAGKRGFAHYNTISNRWKLFGNQQQEQSFLIRLYSRDNNLDNHYVLYTEVPLNTPVYIALCGDFLLVHLRIKSKKHQLVSFLLWRSIEDVISSNILLLVGGKLIILCSNQETEDLGSASSNPFKAYIMSQNTEYYWIGKRSVENLRTSLWIMNGRGLKVFTNFLLPDEFEVSSNIYSESEPTTPTTPGYLSPRHDVGRPFTLGYHMDHEPESPPLTETRTRWRIDDLENLNKEAIYMPLDFYPISILLEGGIIVGIEQNVSYNAALGLVLFKMSPKMHLFLHHIFRHLLQIDLEQDAITFARAYEKYVYFGHALEILLHTVLEEEAGQDLKDDQFRHALDVIVSCARKTEVALWEHLFSVVGKPKDLFEVYGKITPCAFLT
ncbi:hypothetical protein RO3G_14200 [Rhizopus delemar RA 99-880]|uniref:Ribosome control protein 1 domain-containing protein n=1 Tax=Rhizopus delemar (strain RA 99-880 / ATCC MYA-4621 / FGSC 9543 / NRRL 43880) TaxID=246409 RepID=I1CM09_RHIO9|nr:hypothetical protein RO3G_14200 [Rhizopus delemar RA 99-880]|eukprot:EIE89489.1 hypothetical protein RO3G_14200 [Rhizopus delemar RA 99-880]